MQSNSSNNNLYIFEAIKKVDLLAISQLITIGINVNCKNDKGLTPLMVVAALGDVQMTKIFLKNEADVNILDSIMGTSALHFAAQGGNVEVGKLILEYGGQVLLNLQGPTHGLSPLHCAVWYRKPAFVKFLLEQKRINIHLKSSFGGATAFDLVSPDVVRGTTAQPFEKLDHKLKAQSEEITRYFQEYQTKQEQKDKQGQILFETILNQNNLPSDQQLAKVKELIAAGANINYVSPIDSSGNDGHTPILIAVRDGYIEILKVLLENGGDITIVEETMHANPAHKGGYYGQPETLKALTKCGDFSKIINAQGASNGYTPLHDAVWHGHLETAQVLIEMKANLEIKGYDGKTPYDLAKEYDYLDILGLLNHSDTLN